MSTFVPAVVRCRCGAEQRVEVADSLHVSSRPDLRAAILAGEFHRFACPSCGAFTRVDKLFAYTDFPRHQWFTVVPDAQLDHRGEWLRFAERSFRAVFVERALPMVTEWAPRFTRRVIFGMASLREKLVAFDAGLDDRRLEQLKIELVASSRLIFAPGCYCFLVSATDDELVFEWAVPEQRTTTEARISRTEYDQLVPSDATRATELFATPIVDMRSLYIPDLSAEA
jgi:hypothetical protein